MMRCCDWIAVMAVAIAAAGCRAPQLASESPDPVPEMRLFPDAEVIYINPRLEYVILKCAVMPVEGDTLVVYSHGRPEGRVRVRPGSRTPFVAADILDGAPRVGDYVRSN